MQNTRSLILEFGGARKGSGAARQARKRLVRRARKGDELARAFLEADFQPGAAVAIRHTLLHWLRKQELGDKQT